MKLGKKVKPKKGRVIMWPNVWYNSKKEATLSTPAVALVLAWGCGLCLRLCWLQDNMMLHPKTYHAALPVIKGEK